MLQSLFENAANVYSGLQSMTQQDLNLGMPVFKVDKASALTTQSQMLRSIFHCPESLTFFFE